MRTSLAVVIAAAGLLAGASVAAAQQMERKSENGAAQTGVREGHPGATEGQMQGRSASEEKMEKRSGETGTVEKIPSQGRSAAEERKEERHPGMNGKKPSQGRSMTEDKKEQGRTGAVQGPAQGKAGGITGKEERSERPSAMQGTRGRNAEGGVTERRSAASSVALSPDQETRVHEIVTGSNVHRVDNVNFSLAVGTVVPRTVHLYPVPESIVEIIPQYRGFDYIVVGNDLVIIDPDTLEIVAVVPA